jgi:hypothetical protein
MRLRAVQGLNREGERIIKRPHSLRSKIPGSRKKPFASTAALMLPSSPKLAAAYPYFQLIEMTARSGTWKKRFKNWITPPT